MRRWIRAGLALALLAAWPSIANAQLPSCPGVEQAGNKALLDRFGFREGAEECKALASKAKLMRRGLRMRLRSLSPALEAQGPMLLECDNREPTGPTTFKSNVISRLALNSVIIEVWATFDSVATDDGDPGFEVELQWAVFPLCEFDEVGPAPQGFFSTGPKVFPFDHDPSLQELLGSESLFQTYALIGLGIQAAGVGQYDTACRYLRASLCRLRDGDPGDFGAHVQALIDLVIQKATADHVAIVATEFGDACEGSEP